LGKRIRVAELEKVPYIFIVGEKEESTNTVNVRERHKQKTFSESATKLIERIVTRIRERA
jgi:threonyl-tRNA synthetase